MASPSGNEAQGAPDGMRGWIRDMEKAVRDILAAQTRIEQNLDRADKATNSTYGAISNIRAASARVDGNALSAGNNVYVTAIIPTPPGKTRATVLAVGNAAYVDQTTGGVTSLSGSIVINSNSGPVIPASKDAGASRVNNILSTSHSVSVSDVNQIEVSFLIQPLNAGAFGATASNFASLTVIAVFDN